jgi:hypothetical protein
MTQSKRNVTGAMTGRAGYNDGRRQERIATAEISTK